MKLGGEVTLIELFRNDFLFFVNCVIDERIRNNNTGKSMKNDFKMINK